MSTIIDGSLRAKQASAFLCIGVSTLWRWVKEGKLPRPIRLSKRCSVWRVQTLENFLTTRSQVSEQGDKS
jgi:predicted DNA-binding transcriptional regulator AlpA